MFITLTKFPPTRLAEWMCHLQQWHAKRMDKNWFGPIRLKPLSVKLVLLVAIIAFAIAAIAANIAVRNWQYDVWEANSASTYIDGVPSFSTADAPYFLKLAGEIPPSAIGRRDAPLISNIIAALAKTDTPADLLMAGHTLIIIVAGLTALMIIAAFGAAGYWLEGAVAAIGGGLSNAYLVRSAAGRIDTDMLNLGFMYLMFGAVLMTGKAKSNRMALLWCMVASGITNLFMWWYAKPQLAWFALAALVWLLLVSQRNILVVFAGIFLFLIFSGVQFFDPLDTAYVKEVLPFANFIFPNTLETVSEIRQISFTQILQKTAGSLEMGLVCIAGLALWAIRHPVTAIAYGPLAAFGMLNFVIGNRAVFYSAPILWFGAAFLMTSLARFITSALHIEIDPANQPVRQSGAAILASALAMLVAWVNSPTSYVPSPSFPKEVLAGFAALKDTADPKNSVVATWWDYGYASMFLNGLPTLHSGGNQISPSTHFVARALLSPDQSETIGILQFLSSEGHSGISQNNNLASLNTAFMAQPKTSISKTFNPEGQLPDIYLVLTGQMPLMAESISAIGNWDIEAGVPIIPYGNDGKSTFEFMNLSCRYRGFPQKLTCGALQFDLEEGLMNGDPSLAGWSRAANGTSVERRNYTGNYIGKASLAAQNFGLQTIQTGRRLTSQILHRALYESSLNELYHLGVIEDNRLDLIYDDYPHIRIYKIPGLPDNLER